MQTILVTGAAGFIGSHVVGFLTSQGYKVIGIDNFDPFYDKSIKESNLAQIKHPNFKFIPLDIVNFNDLMTIDENIDAVIHLAAKAGVLPSLKNPEAYIEHNIIGTQHVLEFMCQKQIKNLVFASSSSVYGNNKTTPFKESDSVDLPISPYAFTKKACELMNYNYHHLYNLNIINLRFFTVYGPRQRPDMAIDKFFTLINKNQPIRIYGDGTSKRDYTYISDAVNGVYKSLEFVLNNLNVFKTFNMGGGNNMSILQIVKKIQNICEKYTEIIYADEFKSDLKETLADITNAKRDLKYTPKISIDDGLKNYFDWFLKNKT